MDETARRRGWREIRRRRRRGRGRSSIMESVAHTQPLCFRSS